MENVTLKTLEEIQEEFKIKQREIISKTEANAKPPVCIDYTKPEEEENLLPPPEIPEEYITKEEELIPEDFSKNFTLKEKNKGARCVFNIFIILCFVALGAGAGLYFYGYKIPHNIANYLTNYVRQYPLCIGGGILVCLVLGIIFRIIFSYKKSK